MEESLKIVNFQFTDQNMRGLYLRELRYSVKSDPRSSFMEAIVKSDGQRFILEYDLIKIIGSDPVDSLLDYDFHRRPTDRFANDIINPTDEIILSAVKYERWRNLI
ncbi:3476_t:CDS:2 [Ambispora leptoticha]|uniref:3476_t:CDS:1 n=1 Tax=Ambispora leptoticha TaxID=144679 RepID=A0A9N9D549_9GLOM|nr:3476_t:CDS:2 [Ambispora leptoticha]